MMAYDEKRELLSAVHDWIGAKENASLARKPMSEWTAVETESFAQNVGRFASAAEARARNRDDGERLQRAVAEIEAAAEHIGSVAQAVQQLVNGEAISRAEKAVQSLKTVGLSELVDATMDAWSALVDVQTEEDFALLADEILGIVSQRIVGHVSELRDNPQFEAFSQRLRDHASVSVGRQEVRKAELELADSERQLDG